MLAPLRVNIAARAVPDSGTQVVADALKFADDAAVDYIQHLGVIHHIA